MSEITKLERFETGVVFWGGSDPGKSLAELKALGVRCGQMVAGGDFDLASAPAWRDALQSDGFVVTSVVAAFNGEGYADIPNVHDTVGFLPPATRAEREARILQVSDFAATLGVSSIGTHVGCLPHDPTHPDFVAVQSVVQRVCDHAAYRGQRLALETGQEPAPVLLQFIRGVGRANLLINFDPANMILYGSGDPIEALELLGPLVHSVHCKDGDWPPAGQPNALGQERALGTGAVGMERFLRQLVKIGYRGPLAIEREAPDPAERLRDIESGIALLKKLKQSIL
jgi:sugar phosphate isomerase/epimerase